MGLNTRAALRSCGSALVALIVGASVLTADAARADGTPAKELFGTKTLPTQAAAASYGFYSKGCLAGGVAIPTDGPTWQAMRLSRNRRWGHPAMIALIERFSHDAVEKIGWPGLLLGDISQPRGGPMLSGHASHQIGLDADIWLTPMPQRTLSYQERESISATSMLQKDKFLTVDPSIWTPAHARLIMLAASYPQVERVFVNPAIKKKLCNTWTGDRSALGKVRPIYGHDYHFHVRIKCPADAKGCKGQAAVPAGDGCGKSLAWWFTDEPWAKPKKKPEKPVKPKFAMLADLPKACTLVLNGPPPASEQEATYGTAYRSVAAVPAAAVSVEAIIGAAADTPLEKIPVPAPRPPLQ
ncbi:penicillin-insensitive murein endopeptidase [Sinorhizobium numidicum]|uniref:Penicillin-insensitive murein endopeptidase n=1 Tax=Sinorhizobium numidicum TaxID=680248 RepID=A0ABY8D4W9_9HYPH|nr:penicillin-insensitive murein endopeptidase [Sinorhizobium numidicum]WEX77546.1 penicillin-insensitive murein endopeptidase [Sinorhizobium numidicum]WEX84206.1 penicillin-insensitive murein endopeptidase [Sinorhizobium numidicum]